MLLPPPVAGLILNCCVVLEPVQLPVEVYTGLVALLTARQPPVLVLMLTGCSAGMDGPGSCVSTDVVPVVLVKLTGDPVGGAMVLLVVTAERGAPL